MNDAFAERLGVGRSVFELSVLIELPRAAHERPDAAAAWLLAANLLVRMFRRVHLVAPASVRLGANPWHLKSLGEAHEVLASISEGTVEWGIPGQPADVVLAIGAPPVTVGRRTTWCDFDGWTVSVDLPAGDAGAGVFSSLLAACWGASQAFLLAAQQSGAHLTPMEPFRWKLLDADLPCTAADLALHLEDARLVGVGALGCAFVYALGHLEMVTGHLDCIDDDPVDVRNLHRYILMTRADLNAKKPFVAEAALLHLDLDVLPRDNTYLGFSKEFGTVTDLLLTPVDSHAGRRALAATLPRRVLDASTGDHTITVSRHGFADGRACMHCLYVVRDAGATTETRIAEDLGLPVVVVEEHLAENRPMDSEVVAQIERFKGVAPGTFAEHVGARIQSFHQHAVCGSATFQTDQGRVVAPLSFISAAAGVLMAIELAVLLREPAAAAAYNYRRHDVFAQAPLGFVRQRRPAPDTRCICMDEDYRLVFASTYPATANLNEVKRTA